MKQVLLQFWELSKVPLDYPLELYISHFLFQVPMPSKGHVQVLYYLNNMPIIFALPPFNRLPLLDVNMSSVFYLLDLENIVQIFRHLSLEQSVVFLSSKENRLLTVSYTLLSFLYPFEWTMIYVPLLPTQMLDYLYSPVNFVYGLDITNKETVLSICQETALVVDLDSNKIYNRKNLPPLPEHYGKKLATKLKNTLKKNGAKGKPLKLPKVQLESVVLRYIRNIFFQFYVSILFQYKRFINYNHREDSSIFDKTKFLQTVHENSKTYMAEMLKTQMFANFCEERVYPKSVDQYCANLFFDETIIAKDNRSTLKINKTPTPFLDDASQKHRSKYTVPALPEATPGRKYTYQEFPIPNLDEIQPYGLYAEPPPSFENFKDMPDVHIHIASRVPKSNRECIYMAWFEMWAASLWYQDPIEMPERLGEVLNTLEEVNNLPGSVLNSIYKLLLQVTSNVNPSMAIPIYTLMSASNILMDAATIQILQKLVTGALKEEGEIVMRNTGNSLQLSRLPTSISPMGDCMRHRLVTRDANPETVENIDFKVQEMCMSCGAELTATDIKAGWKEGMEFDCECIKCGEMCFPKLNIIITLEDAGKKRTIEEDNLFISPQTLMSLVSQMVDEQDVLDISLLRTYNALIFWNLIYHFQEYELPFGFIVPYCELETISNDPSTSPSIRGSEDTFVE